MGPVERLLRAVLEVMTSVEIVVVSGRNDKLKKQIDKIKPPARHRLLVLGFTDQIDELLTVADLVFSKAGGLTTSETLARAAMAVVNPTPGQETRNSDFLLENGAAIKINNVATMAFKLSELLANSARLTRLKRNAKRLGRPKDAFDVARAALQWPSM